MVKNKKRDMVIMGFAIFAIFFGAGNLIFPPYLGQIAGSDWVEAMFGFLMTDPVIPVVGLIAAALIGGGAYSLGQRVSTNFGKIVATIAMLIIGPFFAVPRTAATVHEIAVLPWFPNTPAYVTSLIYFAITFILIFNQGKVIEIIGKYLTPILLLVLAILIGKSIITPIGVVAAPAIDLIGKNGTFFKGFSEGYQTMDALGAGLTAGIVTADMLRRGYDNPKDRLQLSIGAAAISCILLALVYGGLIYVGATASSIMPAGEFTRVELLLGVSSAILGTTGMMIMAVCVSVACLTTATGLIAMAGNFFSKDIFADKLSYKVLIGICTVISFIVSVAGTEEIIKYAVPLLFVIYPVIVVLIFLTLFDKYIKHDQVFLLAVSFTLFVSLVTSAVFFVEVMLGQKLSESAIAFIAPLNNMFVNLPFASSGFAWLLPAVVGALLGWLWGEGKKAKLA